LRRRRCANGVRVAVDGVWVGPPAKNFWPAGQFCHSRRMSGFEPTESFDTVRVYRNGPAAIVEMHRPEVLNAWNPQLSSEMVRALRACHANDVRAVMVTGAGRGFSSGADLGALAAVDPGSGELPDLERELHARYHPIMREIRRLRGWGCHARSPVTWSR
jgi:hypothetical protein